MDDYMECWRLIVLIISDLFDIISLSYLGFVLKPYYEIKIICLKKQICGIFLVFIIFLEFNL